MPFPQKLNDALLTELIRVFCLWDYIFLHKNFWSVLMSCDCVR